jgi:hypothetical protein
MYDDTSIFLVLFRGNFLWVQNTTFALSFHRVGTLGEPRQRRRERTSQGFTFRFVYVHENATQRGFHTHILCTVPWSLAKDFSAWSMRTLARLARHHGDERTVRVVARYARDEGVAVQTDVSMDSTLLDQP